MSQALISRTLPDSRTCSNCVRQAARVFCIASGVISVCAVANCRLGGAKAPVAKIGYIAALYTLILLCAVKVFSFFSMKPCRLLSSRFGFILS